MSAENNNEGKVLPYTQLSSKGITIYTEDEAAALAQVQDAPPVLKTLQANSSHSRAVHINDTGGVTAHRQGVLATARDRTGLPPDKIGMETLVDVVRPDGTVWSGMTVRDAITADALAVDAHGNIVEIDQAAIAQTKAELANVQQQANSADLVKVDPQVEATHHELVLLMQDGRLDPANELVHFIHNNERISPNLERLAKERGVSIEGVQNHYFDFMNRLIIGGLAKSAASRGVNPDALQAWFRQTGLIRSTEAIGAVLELYTSGRTARLDAMVSKFQAQSTGKTPIEGGRYDHTIGGSKIAK